MPFGFLLSLLEDFQKWTQKNIQGQYYQSLAEKQYVGLAINLGNFLEEGNREEEERKSNLFDLWFKKAVEVM